MDTVLPAKNNTIQEVLACAHECERRCLDGERDCRILVVLESNVAVSCIEKSRSSSVALNKALGTFMRLYFLCGIAVSIVWGSIKLRPSDPPSCDVPFPRPGPSLPVVGELVQTQRVPW